MALAREDIDIENIKRESDADLIVENIMQSTRMISRFQDRQVKMRDEIEEQKRTISNLEDDIQLLKKEKRWNMLWRNSLEGYIAKTQVFLAIVFLINMLFTYFMSR
ncbi:hypothetical protein GCM10025879_19980 [Leuconostoc litchii]|uniref:Uncharacterized protein n=2 Tax=Leuconostoc litchii TaxID=1981069 RepID=A0A6P2CP26_9LACO|nr:hypothetical protein [Leuconostoc litchii]TYC46852.1 hypothetical protein ESZ47_01545 [Leuconostoc litchii]GMA70752.1 hypothetical protein GCM10025879_19980 [Leuconostoc litchii]